MLAEPGCALIPPHGRIRAGISTVRPPSPPHHPVRALSARRPFPRRAGPHRRRAALRPRPEHPPGLARACATDVEDVRRATCGLRDDPDPAIAAAARKWAGVLEQAAERGCPFTRGEGAPDDAATGPARRDARERGLRLVERDEDENDLELTRRWYEDGERQEEGCRVSFPPGTDEAKLEAMKRAWTSGRVTPDHLATPAEREATRRALAEPPPGKDTDLLAAPAEGTATRATAMSRRASPHAPPTAAVGETGSRAPFDDGVRSRSPRLRCRSPAFVVRTRMGRSAPGGYCLF